MRRLQQDRYKLQIQMKLAIAGIQGEPAWPGAPSLVEVQQASAALEAAVAAAKAAETELKLRRGAVDEARSQALAVLRRIDHVTSYLYGDSGSQKHKFGLRPIDNVRNSLGPPPSVKHLVLKDGGAPGVVLADWKRIPGATYEVQWFADPQFTQLAGAGTATRSRLLLAGLTPGMQIWVRVRALRSRRYGDWSDVATRIANV